MTGAGPETISEQLLSDGGLARYEIPTWRSEFGVVAGVTAAHGGFDLRLDADSPDEGYAKRISYVIGEDGRILLAYPKVDPNAHLDQVLSDL